MRQTSRKYGAYGTYIYISIYLYLYIRSEQNIFCSFTTPQAFWQSSSTGALSTLVTSVALYSLTRATDESWEGRNTCLHTYIYIYTHIYIYIYIYICIYLSFIIISFSSLNCLSDTVQSIKTFLKINHISKFTAKAMLKISIQAKIIINETILLEQNAP